MPNVDSMAIYDYLLDSGFTKAYTKKAGLSHGKKIMYSANTRYLISNCGRYSLSFGEAFISPHGHSPIITIEHTTWSYLQPMRVQVNTISDLSDGITEFLAMISRYEYIFQ